jgi:hypothetical protein
MFKFGRSLEDPSLAPLNSEWRYLFWIAPCAGVLTAVSHIKPKLRDITYLLLGIGWTVALTGWQQALAIGALALVVYYAFPRLNSHLALILTMGLALVIAKLGLLQISESIPNLFGFAAMRLAYFAFEQRTLLPGERSLPRMLGYSPFGFTLGLGPQLVSYSTLFDGKPRESLTALGVRQLFRSGLKFIVYFYLQTQLWHVLPDLRDLGHLSLPWRAFSLVTPYCLIYLEFSAFADLGAGICNLAGFHAPDAFDNPLLARDPLSYWHKWNLLVLDFLRRVFIFDSLKWFRARFKTKGTAPLWIVTIVVGFSTTKVIHLSWIWIRGGPIMNIPYELWRNLPGIFWDIFWFAALLPLYYWNQKAMKMPKGALRFLLVLLFWAITQSYFAQKDFRLDRMYQQKDSLTDGGNCLMLQLFDPARDCSKTIRRRRDRAAF